MLQTVSPNRRQRLCHRIRRGQRPCDLYAPRWQPVNAGRSLPPTTRKHTRRFRLRHTHDGDEPQHEPELADSTASDASVLHDSTPHWYLLAPMWRFGNCHFHSRGNTTAITCPPWVFQRTHQLSPTKPCHRASSIDRRNRGRRYFCSLRLLQGGQHNESPRAGITNCSQHKHDDPPLRSQQFWFHKIRQTQGRSFFALMTKGTAWISNSHRPTRHQLEIVAV